MGVFNNKKSEAITLVLIIVIIAVFLGWLINFNSKECRSNSQCAEGFYCGSDFSCHQMPTFEKTIIKNNLLVPSLIISISIIIAAIILRFGRVSLNKKKESKEHNNASFTQKLKTP